LCEIQQHSDITYRLFDYGRPRELHLDEGVRVSHRGPHAARQKVRQGVLVSCPFFTTEKIRVDEERRVEAGRMMIVLEGDLKIAGQRSRAGEAWMAGSEAVDLTGQATVLVIT
jgi:mannose-6-phosphate isomerase